MAKYVYFFGGGKADGKADMKNLLGGKGANLAEMTNMGLAVPPGFVITTATCREYLTTGWPRDLSDELAEQMAGLERSLDRGFGAAADPLLVSVRSGAPVSMPGMMDTVLDLGLTGETTAGLARIAGEAFARECRERFVISFRSITGVDEVPDDPWAQLRLAIEAVFRSWNSERAVAYRRRAGISDDIGTAVTVQAMVFGNRGPTSGTGVAFTRNPSTGEPALYGDVLFDAQGEDIVAGTHATEPIGVLEARLPDIAALLGEYARRLERHFTDLCDIEFTIEDGRLWMLQVRVGKRSPQAALRIAVDMAEDPMFPLSREQAVRRVLPLLADPPKRVTTRSQRIRPLLVGLPASPGVATGPIALTPGAAITAGNGGTLAILVRAETSPDDVPGMTKSAGLVTSRGGLASHAAVIARGWGIPAVVGAGGMSVGAEQVTIGDRVLRAGESITIDGSTGEVFEGVVAGSTEVVPEAAILQGWAADLNLPIDKQEKPERLETAVRRGGTTPTSCLRAIAIKGVATLDSLCDALVSTPDVVQPIAEDLAADGFVAATAGAWTLTDAGKARAGELLQAERTSFGAGGADAALGGFVRLDQRMKEIVTAWQMRDPQTLNDHTDADYDRRVIDRLADLHGDAMGWLVPHEQGVPRLSTYRERLARALERVRAGHHRFVASPRVDSYHGVWFELHEDLIQLAGRTREEETAADRA